MFWQKHFEIKASTVKTGLLCNFLKRSPDCKTTLKKRRNKTFKGWSRYEGRIGNHHHHQRKSVIYLRSDKWWASTSMSQQVLCFKSTLSRALGDMLVTRKQVRTNASILCELDTERQVLGKITSLKLGYFGNILRDSGSALTLGITEGKVEGKRKCGRQKKNWFDNIQEWTG